jgi:ubiquinone/menaquinone biosynthesis C-methylase UbiE
MCKPSEKENERVIKERVLWEKIAPTYDKQSSKFEQAYKNSIEKSKKVLKNTDKVLEIACGTGIISLGIAEQVNNVIGVDISPKMITIAKEKLLKLPINNVNFNIADGYSLQYEDNTFDAILLFNSLHIVKDPCVLLDEAYRLLKPNGYLITATDCYSESVPFFKTIYTLVPRIMNQFGIINYLNCFSKKDIISLLMQNKYEIIEDDILYDAPLNYYVLGQKK